MAADGPVSSLAQQTRHQEPEPVGLVDLIVTDDTGLFVTDLSPAEVVIRQDGKVRATLFSSCKRQ